jgi:hypothetical protein
MGHVSGGSVDEVRVIHAPQPGRLLPACQWSVHPRRQTFRPTPRRMPSGHSTRDDESSPPFGPSHHGGGTMPSADFREAVREDCSPSVLCEDTPQISRGQRSYRRCTDAGFIMYAPLRMEDFVVACPLVPSILYLISGSCPSPRTFVPRCLQTPPRGDALALPLSFGSTHTWTGDFRPQA